MSVESDSDLSVFFDPSDFGTAASYTPAGKRPIQIPGLFDNPSASQSITDMMDIVVPQPRFVCRTADLPRAAEGDKINIKGIKYTVRVVTNDGEGVTSLMLEKDD